MGFGVDSLLRRLTTAYDIETREPNSLPTGFNLTTSKVLTEGEASSTKVLTFILEAYNEHTVTVDPNTGIITWETTGGGEQRVRCPAFTSWEVVTSRIDQYILKIGNNALLEVHAAGIVRLVDCTTDLELLGPEAITSSTQLDDYAQFTGHVPFVGPELITEGSIETDLTHWASKEGAGSIVRDTSEAKFGTASVRADLAGAPTPGDNDKVSGAVSNNAISIQPNATYALSCWAKGGDGFSVRALVLDSGQSIIQDTIGPKVDGDEWVYVTHVFDTPSNADAVNFTLRSTESTGSVWFDGISLVELPSAFEGESSSGWISNFGTVSTVPGIRGNALEVDTGGSDNTDLQLDFSPQDWSRYRYLSFWSRHDGGSTDGLGVKLDGTIVAGSGVQSILMSGDWEFHVVNLEDPDISSTLDLSEVTQIVFSDLDPSVSGGNLYYSDHITLHTEAPSIGAEHGFLEAFGPEEDLVGWWKLDETGGTDGSNLVSNPDFENWTTGDADGWGKDANIDDIEETTDVFAGGSSLRMQATDDAAVSFSGVNQNISGLQSDTSYYVEGWLKKVTGSPDPRLAIANSTDGVPVLTLDASDDTQYTKVSGTFYVDSAADTYVIECRWASDPSNGDEALFDSLVVQEIQAKDASGEGNHMTLRPSEVNNPGPTVNQTTVHSGLGTAYNFDDVDNGQMLILNPTPSSLLLTDDITIEAWVNLNALSNGTIFATKNKDFAEEGFHLAVTNTGILELQISDGVANEDAASDSALSTSTWHHVAVTYRQEDDEVDFYIDGVLDTTKTYSTVSAPAGSTSVVRIGAEDFNNASEFPIDAKLDEIRVYSRALGADEVAQRFNATEHDVRGLTIEDGDLDLTSAAKVGGKGVVLTNITGAGATIQKTFTQPVDWSDYRYLSFWAEETGGGLVNVRLEDAGGTTEVESFNGSASLTYHVIDLTGYTNVDLSQIVKVRFEDIDAEGSILDGIKLTAAEGVGDWRLVEDTDASEGIYVSNGVGSTTPATSDKLSYQVQFNVPKDALYDITLAARSPTAGTEMEITVGGEKRTVELPTDAWANNPSVTASDVELTEGDKNLRVELVTGNNTVELDKLTITRVANNADEPKTIPDHDIDSPFRHLTGLYDAGTNWWAASNGAWSTSNGKVTLETGDNFTIFFNNTGKHLWLADLNSFDAEDLKIGGGIMERIMRVFRMGYFARWEQSKDEVEKNLPVVDRKGPALTLTGQFWGEPRGAGQSDADALLDLLFEIRKRIGNTTHKGLQQSFETALNATQGDIEIIENVDPIDGGYRSRYFEAIFTDDALDEAFDPPFDDDVQRLEALIERVKAAGVRGVAKVQAAAVYASGSFILNGDFEDYETTPGLPPEWTNLSGNSTTFDREETIIFDGDQALKITTDGTGGIDEGVEQEFDVPSATDYSARVQVRTGGTAGEIPTLEVFNVTDAVSEGTASGTDGGTTYEELEVTWTADSAKTYSIRLLQESAAGGEVLYFDQALVEMDIADPATYDTDDVYST